MAGNDQQETHALNPGGTDDQVQAAQPQVTDSLDPDDIELREAKAAAQAEVAAPEANAQDGSKPAEPQAPQQGVKPQDQDREQIMIPKARLDDEIAKRNAAEQRSAYLAGQVEALRAGQPAATPAQPATPPQKTAAERLQEVHSQIDALAAKFDAGELTFAEMKRQERALNDTEQSIREEQLLSKVRPQQPQAPTPQGDPLYLDRLTADLEEKHPYLAEITSDQDFNWLVQKAQSEFAAQGVRLTNSDADKYRLRERVAVLSDKYGEMLTGKKISPQGAAQPSNGQPQLSPEAKARQDKLNLQGDLPPSVASMTGGAQQATPTDAAIEAMSDEEIAALPSATRHKALGITA